MSVQLPITETRDVPLSTITTDVPGLQEVYRLVNDTQHLLDTMSTSSLLFDDAVAGTALCPLHAVALEQVIELVAVSLEQRIGEMEQQVGEMKQRMAALEQYLGYEEQLVDPIGAEGALDCSIDGQGDGSSST